MWLIEWLENAWQELLLGMTASSLIALIVMIVKTIITGNATNKLHSAVRNLTSDLSAIANTKEDIVKNTETIDDLLKRIDSLEIELNANNKALEAILSIMGIVYMRNKDEDIRSSVTAILSTFKNGDVTIRNLKLELEHVKEQLSQALSRLTTTYANDKEVEAPNVAAGDAETSTEVLMRG